MRPDRPFKWDKPRERAAWLVAEDELTDAAIAEELKISKATLERWKSHPDFQDRVQENLGQVRDRIRQQGIAVVENRVKALHSRWELLDQVRRERAADPSMRDVPGGKTGLLVRRGKLVKVYEPLKLAQSAQEEGDTCPLCEGNYDDAEDAPRLRMRWVISKLTDEETEQLICPECGDRWRDTDQLSFAKLSEMVYEYELDGKLLAELRAHEEQAAKELGQWTERKDLTSDGKQLGAGGVIFYIPDNGRDSGADGDPAAGGPAGDLPQ